MFVAIVKIKRSETWEGKLFVYSRISSWRRLSDWSNIACLKQSRRICLNFIGLVICDLPSTHPCSLLTRLSFAGDRSELCHVESTPSLASRYLLFCLPRKDLINILADKHVTVARTSRTTCLTPAYTNCLCCRFGQRRNSRPHIRISCTQTENCDRRSKSFDPVGE